MTYKGATFEPYILDNLPDELNDPLIPPSFNEDIKVTLPTNLRFDLDWAISDKFYLNTSSRISLISKKKTQAIRYANQFTVNPRLETRWLSVYSPLSVTQFGGMQWGLGTRLGPLFLGSGNLLGSIVDKKTRAFDVYMGLKIPLFHPIPKVKEEKETVTKLDCPFGCPEIKSGKVKRLEGYGNDSKRIKKRKVKRLQGYQGKVK